MPITSVESMRELRANDDELECLYLIASQHDTGTCADEFSYCGR